MSLEFADFAHYYEGSGLSEAEQRDDFDVYASFMECLVGYFWRRERVPNAPGISVDKDTIARVGMVDSTASHRETFNDAAQDGAAGKITP